MTIRENRKIRINAIALILIFVSNICFYTAEYITLYRILSGIGITIAIVANLNRISTKIRVDNCILWLLLMYSIYLTYGFLRMQKGIFNGDVLIYRLLECIAFYISISSIFKRDYRKVVYPFTVAGLISIVFLVWSEGAIISAGGSRIGDTLSGNVNTVGFNFGIVSMLLMWLYCLDKRKIHLILFALFVLFMILTGSKKALIIIVFDLLMVFVYQKEKASTWLKLAIVIAASIYAIFNIPYLYNILGIRIESMFLTWRYGTATAIYSYSTDMRDVLIKEGFNFFTEHPIFGGGYNYFYSRTSTHYDYSHCNYIEMLCNFGMVGTVLYYMKHISNLRFFYHCSRFHQKYDANLERLGVFLLLQTLILDWGAVTFSAQAVWYLPVIISCVVVNQMRIEQSVEKKDIS